MGRLVLGIIAVVCLDIGFVAFMANNRAVESAKLVISNAYEDDLAAGEMVAPASLAVYDGPQEPIAEPVGPERRIFVPVYIVRQVEVAAKAMVPKQDPIVNRGIETPRPTERIDFAARIIEIRQQKINTEKSEAEKRDLIYELATSKDRRPEKRSFVASTVVPVVKKPWDLLKAFGDKLK